MTQIGMRPQEADRILDAFEDALNEALELMAHLRQPSSDSERHKAFSAELVACLHDGGWSRWGWPNGVGELGGSATIRCLLASRIHPRGVGV